MKKLKLLSTITNKINKIGILTNRKTNKENKNELINIKNPQDIDNIIQKIKSILDTRKIESNKESNYTKIEKLENYLITIENSLLDINNFNYDLFQYLLDSKLIPILSENINIYSNKISNIIIIFLRKIIFLDEIFIINNKIKEETIITNPKIVSSIKKIIFEIENSLKKVNIIEINSDLNNLIITGILPFLNELFGKIITYQNLFYALMNNSTTININLELQLFDILFILTKFEPQIKDRTSRAYIRKNLLRFINNFNFQNRKELLKKLINQVILNLIEYYQNFLLLSIKDINDNYKILNNFPLNLSENDIMELISDDTLSYLEFFNIIINNFLEKDLKIYLIDLLYNNFLCKYILEEIINLANDISYKARSTLLIEYIYFLSKSIKNYDINILFFYFFFGYNLNSEQDNNDINFSKIISKSNNNYESIRAFFTLIFESNNTNLLILLMKTLTNLVKRIPYIFISEMVSPFYLFYLNKKKASDKDFKETLETITKKQEHISLLEVIKLIMPQNFSISPKNWIYYFIKNLEINYQKNINNLNQMNNNIIQDFINDSSLMNKSDGNMSNISYNYKNMVNISNYSFSDYNNNDSIFSSRNNNLNESIFGNNSLKEGENEIINISIENKFSYILNSTIFASRVKFFELFIKKFKNYVNNKYEENLYLSEFFEEIFSFLTPLSLTNDDLLLYNIYSCGAFSKKNNDKLFDVSAMGILNNIKNQIDKKVLDIFSKEEIDNFEYFLSDKNYEIFEMNVDLNTSLGKRIEFLKNIKLYNEIFKDFSSNIFSKILNDESNHYWIKGIKKDPKNNE